MIGGRECGSLKERGYARNNEGMGLNEVLRVFKRYDFEKRVDPGRVGYNSLITQQFPNDALSQF